MITPNQFLEADGLVRIRRAVRRDSDVQAAIAATSAELDDIVNDGLLYVLERFELILSRCPPGKDPVKWLIGRAVFAAKDAATLAGNGYHSNKRLNEEGELKEVPATYVRESDLREGGQPFEPVFGQSVQNEFIDSMWVISPARFQEFRLALYTKRPDLFDRWMPVLWDKKAVNAETRRELRRALTKWEETGELPSSGKYGIVSLPTFPSTSRSRFSNALPIGTEFHGFALGNRYVLASHPDWQRPVREIRSRLIRTAIRHGMYIVPVLARLRTFDRLAVAISTAPQLIPKILFI